jgi:hypothetical protein
MFNISVLDFLEERQEYGRHAAFIIIQYVIVDEYEEG